MYRVISNHPNYVVTETGRVYRILTDGCYSELLPDVSNGYFRYDLDGKKEYAGRLVLEAFDPVDDPSLKVFYIDGIKTNCHIDNLVWLTPSEVQRYSSYTIEYRVQLLRGLRGRG